ncbi:V-type ATP synthase subunit A [candidate division KSB1 bacterium]|nr:V-type ATP synthase subunit A [candidate division KSB1 bacterium]
MNSGTGKIVAINGNMISVEFTGNVRQNEVGYAKLGDMRLKSEVIRVRGNVADLQVFEDTRGLKIDDKVEFTHELLAVELGPGLLTSIFDGLQNPLPELAEKSGFFLKRGIYFDGLPRSVKWDYTPVAKVGDEVTGGTTLGTTPEGIFTHQIKVPFLMRDNYTVEWTIEPGEYTVDEVIAKVKDSAGNVHKITMVQVWPVKVSNKMYQERLAPTDPLITGQRIIDTFFPVNKGGTYCIPGPFGAGKTVLQHITSRHAAIDIVIIAACGERAGEVVEILREFPHLTDPRTGKALIERTVIICNTSSMPVAAREASVYTAVSIGEYYRSMGLDVLLLADSTSRWAQALREMSGRLEEIPGEEAFPAYLESRIAEFYERAGRVRNYDGSIGSLTIGGTVSPAGGNFNEPVTQSTLKVVKAFHGLSRERSDARRFPAIDPLDSWSKAEGAISSQFVSKARSVLQRGYEISQMMTVVGREGISTEEFTLYQKSEILDRVYLQQNAFHPVDASCSAERQKEVFIVMIKFLDKAFDFENKDEARDQLLNFQEKFLRWNTQKFQSKEYKKSLDEFEAQLN